MLVIRSTDCSVSARCCSSSCRRLSRRAISSAWRVSACGQPAFGSGELLLDFRSGFADLLVGFLYQLGEGQSRRGRRSDRFRRHALLATSSRKGASACSCSQSVASGRSATAGRSIGRIRGSKVADNARLLKSRGTVVRQSLPRTAARGSHRPSRRRPAPDRNRCAPV